MEKTANRIKQLREKAGLNQSQLAKKIGISEQSISKYERGKRKPKIETIEALADFFKVPVSYLRGEAAVNRLKKLRQSKGLTLDDIEKATGINRGTYSNYENGNTEPKMKTWNKLASFFGVSTAYLLGLDKDSNNLRLKNGGRKLRTKFFTTVIDVDKSIDQKINEWIETSNPSMRIIDIKFQTNYSAPILTASALIIYEDDGSSEGYASDEEYKERLENFLRELESKENAD